MLPRDLLRVSTGGPEVAPAYLLEPDYLWLRTLLDEYRRFAGRPRRELDERMQEPLPVAAAPRRVLAARHVLDRFCRSAVAAPVPPRRIRAVVFTEAARAGWDARRRVLESAEAELGMDAAHIEEHLFGDLGPERRLVPPPQDLGPEKLALHVNLALVQGLVSRATSVRAAVRGNARQIVQYARLRGLLCTVRGEPEDDAFLLDISGPLSLFRRTTVYGRALAGLVPRLAWCHRWELTADCVLREDLRRRVVVRSGAPIFPGEPPAGFDSRLEARFARDFLKAAPDWDLVREPRPVPCGERLCFPDFEIVHRRQRDRRWIVEVVGFWTADYLERKLAQLRVAAGRRWIVCLDADRACGRDELPAEAHVVPFRRRIDVGRVVGILEDST